MITEEFNEKIKADIVGKLSWAQSPKKSFTQYYLVDENGKIHGHVVESYDVWKAVFNYTTLGSYISKETAQAAVVASSVNYLNKF